jgi:hypothetical protein
MMPSNARPLNGPAGHISNRLMDWNRPACVAFAALLAVFVSSAVAQDTKSKSGEDKVLTAIDGWQIHITYFKSTLGKDAPVVILLHNKGGNRLVWNPFAQKLNDAGYAVVTVDLRKHGQSTGVLAEDAGETKKTQAGGDATDLSKADYVLMGADLEAIKQFLYDEHQQESLNMRRTAIVAPEMSTPITVAFTQNDWLKKPAPDAPTLAARTPRGQDIQALVIISPESTVNGVTGTTQLLNTLKEPNLLGWGNIAFLFCVGKKDGLDKRQADKLYRQVSNPKTEDRVYKQEYDTNFRGTDLIGKNLKVEDHILVFLDKHLKNLDGPAYDWRDRKPRNK